jgi:glycosyltransferase involved in cell wall biosynthesis
MSKNIAILISGMAPGGAEASIVTILPEFIKDHKVDMYLLSSFSTEIHVPSHPNLAVIRLNASGVFDLKSFLSINRDLKKYDIIFAHLFWAQIWTGVMGIFSSKIKGKLIWFEHNCYVKRQRHEWVVVAFLGKFTKRIVSVSQEVADFLYRKARLSSIVIPNPIKISPDLSCDLPNSSSVNIAFFGRLVSQKRPDLAILEFEKYLNLKEVNVTDKLFFIGDGYLQQELKIQLANKRNFEFKGYLIHSLAIEELRKCQIYLNTSDFEGFCIARIEALSLGQCVVSRKNAGYLLLKSFFENENEMREFGIYFVDDNESIAEMLIELNNFKYWTPDKIGKRKDLVRHFKPSDIALKYLSL